MIDIAIDSGYNISITGGDFGRQECLAQSQRLLLITTKGEWKIRPESGVGIVNWLESVNDGRLMREIRTQMESDGMKVNSINMNDNNIEIDAEWK